MYGKITEIIIFALIQRERTVNYLNKLNEQVNMASPDGVTMSIILANEQNVVLCEHCIGMRADVFQFKKHLWSLKVHGVYESNKGVTIYL